MFTPRLCLVKRAPRSDVVGSRWDVVGWTVLSVLAVGAVWPALWAPPAYIGDGIDVYGTFWFYGWVDHCVRTFTDPSFTDWMFHPYGKDIFAHTGGNIVDALVSLPFQWLLGTPGFQPVFIVSVLLANGWAFRRLINGLGVRGFPGWAATALWMLNPYVLFELLTGRITQAFLVFLPLAIHHFLRIGEGRRRDAVYAGLFTALQAWTYWFMGLFMAVGFAGLAVSQALEPSRSLRFWLRRWGLAAGACAVLVVPAAIGMTAEARADNVPGLGGAGGLSGFWAAVQGGTLPHLHGILLSEQNGVHFFGYWAWAALALVVLIHPVTRGRWGVLLAVAAVFSVGPDLSWAGSERVPMPHYLLGLHTVPFMERLWFPYRWVVMAMLGACVGLGLLLARTPPRYRGLAGCAVVALGLFPQVRAGTYPLTSQGWEMSSIYEEIGARGGGIIELPMMVPRKSLMFQWAHRQVLFGGMGENARVFWPDGFKHRMGNHFVRALRTAVRTEDGVGEYEAQDRAIVVADGMRWVVLDRRALMDAVARTGWYRIRPESREGAAARTVARLNASLGDPVAVDGGLVVWDLKSGPTFDGALSPRDQALTSTEWTGGDWAAFEDAIEERLKKEGVIQ